MSFLIADRIQSTTISVFTAELMISDVNLRLRSYIYISLANCSLNAPVISKSPMLIPIRCARGLFYPGNHDHPERLQSDTSRLDVTFFFSPDRWGADILLMGLSFIETTTPH
jgi:hypothetical protein